LIVGLVERRIPQRFTFVSNIVAQELKRFFATVGNIDHEFDLWELQDLEHAQECFAVEAFVVDNQDLPFVELERLWVLCQLFEVVHASLELHMAGVADYF